MSRYDKHLWKEISTVLLRDWDPIGVNDNPECEDEKESYVGGIYRMIVGDADRNKLAQHLIQIETEQMGLGNPDKEERYWQIAELLLALRA